MSYRLVDARELDGPTGRVLATGSLHQAPHDSSTTEWWAAFRDVVQAQSQASDGNLLAVRVQIGSTFSKGLAASLKSLLDGLIASLHVHDGTQREHVTQALANAGDGEALWEQLTDPSMASLGPRRLVRPHGTGIAWNPADEVCGYIEVVRTGGPHAVNFSVSAVAE